MSEASFCWWCGGKLSKTFATVQGPDGPVRTHKVCEADTLREINQITAREREFNWEDINDE